MKKNILFLLYCIASSVTVTAQPQVNADYSVTFRVFAPKADSVAIEGDLIMELTKNYDFTSNRSIPFVRGADGVWSVKLGPLDPEPYMYNIKIDGMSGTDPNNFRIFNGQKYRKSILLISTADTSSLWEVQMVDHGTIHRHTYYSTVSESLSELYVYTPPGYEKSKLNYPVLYLLHGRGERADSWLSAGFVNNIMDNLIARGKALPMIIVMPFGWVVSPKTADRQVINKLMSNMEEEMFKSIIPVTEESYRVLKGHRAIAGFSMGGAQTGYIGFNNTDKFSYVGIFSAGLQNFKNDHKELINNPTQTNKRLKYLFLGAGSNDNIGPGGSSIRGQRSLDSLLTVKGINHTFYEMPQAGHTWHAWRYYLAEKFLPYLWQQAELVRP